MKTSMIPVIALSFSSAVFLAACSSETEQDLQSSAQQMENSAQTMAAETRAELDAAGSEAMNEAEQAQDALAEAGEEAMDSAESTGERIAESTREGLNDAGNAVSSAVDSTGQFVADSAITGEIKAKYIAEADLAAFEIDVDTEGGAVTLSGSVASEPAKSLAGEIASNVDGVKSVVNDLSIDTAAQ